MVLVVLLDLVHELVLHDKVFDLPYHMWDVDMRGLVGFVDMWPVADRTPAVASGNAVPVLYILPGAVSALVVAAPPVARD